MRTLRKLNSINMTFIHDLKNKKNDDFIVKRHHGVKAVVSLRNRKVIVDDYTKGPKLNTFCELYHWNPGNEMALIIRIPVRTIDHFRKWTPNRLLENGTDKRQTFFIYGFDNDTINNDRYKQLITYLEDDVKDVKASNS